MLNCDPKLLGTCDPKILFFAFVGGIIPSLLWLWFWTREENHKESKKALSVVFFLGILAVICVLPIQKIIHDAINAENIELVILASSEELIKFLAVLVIFYQKPYKDDHLQWPIYLITAALGFAALENTLFLIKPLTLGQNTVSLLTGQLRFLGSTLLHTVSSGILGITLGISLHLSGFKKFWYVIVGFILAISLHSVFNFFIIRNDGNDFIKVFAFLWVVTIIVMLLFEKLRRMY